MDDDLKQIKAALRKTLLEQTQALPEDYLAHSDRGIANALLAFDLWKNARTVFLYVKRRERTRYPRVAPRRAGSR